MSEIKLIDIVYDGCKEPIHCEKISDNIYRCMESCIFIDFINYGCEIEIKEENGKLIFLGLYKKSPYKKISYIWSKEILESNNGKKIKEEIVSLGGYWESAMGGVFIIHLPKEKVKELRRILEFLKS